MIEKLHASENHADFAGKFSLKDINALPAGTMIASNVGHAKPALIAEINEENAKDIFDQAKRLRLTGTKLYGFQSAEGLAAHLSHRRSLSK